MNDPDTAGTAPERGAGTSHVAVDPEAVERLRARVGVAGRGPSSVVPAGPRVEMVGPSEGPGGLKAQARKEATPVVARLRVELDRAAAGEVAALRSEVAELRAEIARLRAESEAAMAALREDRR